MKQLIVVLFAFYFIAHTSNAQPGQRGTATTARVYGKILDEATGKSLEFAVVQVFQNIQEGDSTRKKLITGALTAANGDFDVINVPLKTPLIISFKMIGYAEQEQPLQLDNASDRDIGNIRLAVSSTLNTIEIVDSVPEFRLEFDKRIYEVDKNPANVGGTVEDVFRNIPSLQVDTEGNVALRNSSPQIFVDGRPTTLTIDQIPADAIQRVEIITNPSAKYDASGGGGGIVNIIMKQNRFLGYNGSLRAGVDKRGRLNCGLDMNLRQGKINFFVNGNANQRRTISNGTTHRISYGDQTIDMDQSQESINNGLMLNGKMGIDWFIDNRNTITVSQGLHRGEFNPYDVIELTADTLTGTTGSLGKYYRVSNTSRQFQNLSSSILYKHLFAKEGTELTADINYNAIKSEFFGDYGTRYNDGEFNYLRQDGDVEQSLITSQADFSSVLNEKTKLEAGIRGSIRNYESVYDNYVRNANGEYVPLEQLQVNYRYVDQVVAAYSTLSKDYNKWKVQVGLRLESSDYSAELIDSSASFRNKYPLSLFPSAYITRIIDDKQDIQLAMNRKINRPGFMQLSPFTDYSDSLNVARGNPSLKPEFTHLIELSYQNVFNKKNSFIASLYVRYTKDVTVRYQLTECSPILLDDVVVNTYANASSSSAFGLELVSRNSITKWFDLTTNFNLYQSSIDGTNISSNLSNSISSYWIKLNGTVKLPKNIVVVIMGDYNSKKALDVGSGERMGGGGGQGSPGGGGWGGSNNTVQGYMRPSYSLDITVRKEFLKDRSLSVSISAQDILRSRVNDTHTESIYFIQDSYRVRDQQFWRLNVSWKFGKVDASLFRRKNTKSSGGEGMEG